MNNHLHDNVAITDPASTRSTSCPVDPPEASSQVILTTRGERRHHHQRCLPRDEAAQPPSVEPCDSAFQDVRPSLLLAAGSASCPPVHRVRAIRLRLAAYFRGWSSALAGTLASALFLSLTMSACDPPPGVSVPTPVTVPTSTPTPTLAAPGSANPKHDTAVLIEIVDPTTSVDPTLLRSAIELGARTLEGWAASEPGELVFFLSQVTANSLDPISGLTSLRIPALPPRPVRRDVPTVPAKPDLSSCSNPYTRKGCEAALSATWNQAASDNAAAQQLADADFQTATGRFDEQVAQRKADVDAFTAKLRATKFPPQDASDIAGAWATASRLFASVPNATTRTLWVASDLEPWGRQQVSTQISGLRGADVFVALACHQASLCDGIASQTASTLNAAGVRSFSLVDPAVMTTLPKIQIGGAP